MSVVTRTGDSGETGLLYGGRVAKDDARVEAYGAIDETVAALGLARALSTQTLVRERVVALQKELFTIGAELATDPAHYAAYDRHFSRVTPEMTQALHDAVDEIEDAIAMPPTFIVPGATPASAALDVARTQARRAERRAAVLKRQGRLENPEILRYLNRVSDLIYTLARYECKDADPELLAGGRA